MSCNINELSEALSNESNISTSIMNSFNNELNQNDPLLQPISSPSSFNSEINLINENNYCDQKENKRNYSNIPKDELNPKSPIIKKKNYNTNNQSSSPISASNCSYNESSPSTSNLSNSLIHPNTQIKSNVIIALCCTNRTLGISCYDELNNTIFCDSIVLSSGDTESIINNIKITLQPTLFLLHPTIVANAAFLELILKKLDDNSINFNEYENDQDDDILNRKDTLLNYYKYKVLKTSSWNEKNINNVVYNSIIIKDNFFLPRSHYDCKTTKQNYNISVSSSTTSMNYSNKNLDTYNNLSRNIDLDSQQLKQSLVALVTFLLNDFIPTTSIPSTTTNSSVNPPHRSSHYYYDGKFVLNSVISLPSTNFLKIDNNSLKSLQIFSVDYHPNTLKKNSLNKNKEGYSFYGIFNLTKSKIGKKKLKEFLLKPLNNLILIHRRYNIVHFILKYILNSFSTYTDRKNMNEENSNNYYFNNSSTYNNDNLYKSISQNLKKVGDLPILLLKIKKVEATYYDWYNIFNTLTASYNIYILLYNLYEEEHEEIERDEEIRNQQIDEELEEYTNNDNQSGKNTSERKNRCSFIKKFLTSININIIKDLIDKLNYIIDFDLSLKEKELVIKENYDEILDKKREVYANLEEILVQAAQKILFLTPQINKVYVEYLPQIGYLVALDEEEREKILSAGLINETPCSTANGDTLRTPISYDNQTATTVSTDDAYNSKFTFVYYDNHTYYYKHPVVYELDSIIGDIKNEILDRQRYLTIELEEYLLNLEPILITLIFFIAEFDVFLSFSLIAKNFNLVEPKITKKSSIFIVKNSRHLLQELIIPNFVPNDFYLTEEKSVGIITGTNGSGKSVYLKQAGLITYLAHIGCFVPCERAIIGLTDRIFTRISSDETVSNPQSSFTFDLNQISKIIKYSTRKSLCLIDEFGKGTSPFDGMALLASLIKFMVEKKAKCLFALHFTEIIHQEIMDSNSMRSINCFRMETFREEIKHSKVDDNEDDDEIDNIQLVPLYKLKFGLENSSEGIACAERMGVEMEVIKRAKLIKEIINTQHKLPPNTMNRRETFQHEKDKALVEKFLMMKFPKFYSENNEKEEEIIIDKEFEDSFQNLLKLK